MPHDIQVSQTASTNTYLSRLAATLPGGTVIYPPCQTAGRGQKGNSWESEFSDRALEAYLLETVEGQGRTGILSAVYFSDLKPQFQYSFQEAGAVDSYTLIF